MSLQRIVAVVINTGGGNGSGSFLSNEIARVDPSGNDGTGTVGDLNKPFLTVQGAIDAIEAGSFSFPIIDIGNNKFSGNVTTSLERIRFIGTADEIKTEMVYYSRVCDVLTVTNAAPVVELLLCEINKLVSTTTFTLKVGLTNAGIAGNNGGITAAGPVTISGNGPVHAAVTDIITSTNGGTITLRSLYAEEIDSAGSDIVALRGTLIRNVTNADNVSLSDSRIFNSNGASGTTTQSDELLTTIVFPNSDPHIAGAGYWVGSTFTKSAG